MQAVGLSAAYVPQIWQPFEGRLIDTMDPFSSGSEMLYGRLSIIRSDQRIGSHITVARSCGDTVRRLVISQSACIKCTV